MIINKVFVYIPVIIMIYHEAAQFNHVHVENTKDYHLTNEDLKINPTAVFNYLKMKTVHQEKFHLKSFQNQTKRNTGFETEESIFLNDVYEKFRLISDTFRQDINDNSTEINRNMTVEDDRRALMKTKLDKIAREDGFKLTTPEENPYSVLLIAKVGRKTAGFCTGSLLTPEWVLTAAHCLESEKGDRFTQIDIYAGGYSYKEISNNNLLPESQLKVSRTFYPHPKYKHQGDADIGLIKVDGKFNLTRTVNTVKLSTRPWTYHSYYICNMTGFGIVQRGKKSADDNMRKTHTLQVKSPCLCSFKLKMMFGSKTAMRYICSKLKKDFGVCHGDSGGGLVCDGEVKAIAMQIINLRRQSTCELAFLSPLKCGARNVLSVFEDTCPYLRWINKYVKLYNNSEISPKCVYTGESSKRRPNNQIYMCFLAGIIMLFS